MHEKMESKRGLQLHCFLRLESGILDMAAAKIY